MHKTATELLCHLENLSQNRNAPGWLGRWGGVGNYTSVDPNHEGKEESIGTETGNFEGEHTCANTHGQL